MQGSEQVLEFIEAEAPTALIPRVRDMLGAFLFRGDDVYKSVSVLSGGEKSRLALLRMLLKPMNLLILDEPTNHLDLHSKDILLDTLRQFKGTIVFVSHDRAFMEALSTKTLELSPADDGGPAQARLFFGNYGYYLEKISVVPGDLTTNHTNHAHEQKDNYAAMGSAAEQRVQGKQKQAAIRRLQRQEADLLNAIEGLEREKSRLEAELSRPEVYSIGEKAGEEKRKLDACVAALVEKNAEWEALAAELDKAVNGEHG